MNYDFSVAGYGWKRKINYTEGEEYLSVCIPGGGELVARMLEQRGFTVAPVVIPGREQVEHLSLTSPRDIETFSTMTHVGVAKGNSKIKPQEAGILIVYDDWASNSLKPKDSSVLHESDLPLTNCPVLWVSQRNLPNETLFGQIKERCFLMLSADVFRNAGALISHRVSWERTATDLVWQIKNNIKFKHLHGVSDILVVFAEDGAVYIRQDKDEWKARLILTHGGYEGKLRDENRSNIPDTWMVMVAGVAIAWKALIEASINKNIEKQIVEILY